MTCRRRDLRSIVAMFASLALVGAGCGSGGDSVGDAPTVDDSGALPLADDTSDPPLVVGACIPEEPDCEDTLVGDPEPQDLPDATGGEDREAELVGRWEVTEYQLPEGGRTNVVGDEPVFIEFAADGTISYNTGCNGGTTGYTTSGTYAVPKSALDDTPEGQAITIGPSFEQTERGCEGFLGDQDLDLPANMSEVTRFVFRDDHLLLLDEFALIDASRSSL